MKTSSNPIRKQTKDTKRHFTEKEEKILKKLSTQKDVQMISHLGNTT